ncbi:MAG: hypothetical protein WDN26_12510 [Chitinophagaceae bacterium]
MTELKKGIIMKSIIMPGTVQLNHKEIDQLTKEVKETLATTNVNNQTKKNFTVAEMWNSRRNLRSASNMIRRWNLN